MNVLIDTNVILDILLRREPYFEDAAMIGVLSEKGYIVGYISASAVTDVFYVAKRALKNKATALILLKNILKTIRVASITEDTIYEALDLNWDDFEDSVQYVVGQSLAAEYIITRNPSDFAGAQIEAVLPEVFLNQIMTNEAKD